MSQPMLPSLKASAIHGSNRVMTFGTTVGCVYRYQFKPSANAFISAWSQGGQVSYNARNVSGSVTRRILRSR